MIFGSALGLKAFGLGVAESNQRQDRAFRKEPNEPQELKFPALAATPRKYGVSRPAVQQHIDLNLKIDPIQKRFEGKALLTFSAQVDNLEVLNLESKELSIIEVRAAKASPAKASKSNGEKGVTKMSSQGPWVGLTFENSDGRLKLDLKPLRLERHDGFAVEVSYFVQNPNAGVYFVDEIPGKAYGCAFTQGQDTDAPHWFPCQDDPRLKVTSSMTLRFPKHWLAAANGVQTSVVEEGDNRVEHWEMNTPHSPYLLAFAMGDLEEFSGMWKDKNLRVLLPKVYRHLGEECIAEMEKMLEFYSSYWGYDYPFPQYTQAFVREFPFGGMENTTCTINTDEALGPISFSREEDFRSVLVMHEMAHQWFGDTLTCDTWSEGWLNEGFATHSETLWHEHVGGPTRGLFYQEFDCKQGYIAESASYQRPMVTNHYEYPSEVFDAHLYQKGSMVLHALREMLGEKVFREAVGEYLRRYEFRSVTTVEFRRALEEASGRDLEEFFDQYVFSAGHVEIEVTYKTDESGILSLDLIQNGIPKAFEAKLLVTLESGEVKEVLCEGRKKTETLSFPLSAKVSYAFLDPRSCLVGTVEHKLSESQTKAILACKNASAWLKYSATKRALKEFPKLEEPWTWVTNETCPLVRREMYALLATSSCLKAQTFVLQSHEQDPKVFPYWVQELGNLDLIEPSLLVEKLGGILRLHEGDLSKTKSILALIKLAATRPEVRRAPLSAQVWELAKRGSEIPSYNGFVAGHALELMAELSSALANGPARAADALEHIQNKFMDKDPLSSRRTLGAARALSALSARFPELRNETQLLLKSLVLCTEPTRLMTQVPALFSASQDLGLVPGLQTFLDRKPYGVLSMVLPRARRSLKKLLKATSGNELGEKLSVLEELKTKVEKMELELKQLKEKDKPAPENKPID